MVVWKGPNPHLQPPCPVLSGELLAPCRASAGVPIPSGRGLCAQLPSRLTCSVEEVPLRLTAGELGLICVVGESLERETPDDQSDGWITETPKFTVALCYRASYSNRETGL